MLTVVRSRPPARYGRHGTLRPAPAPAQRSQRKQPAAQPLSALRRLSSGASGLLSRLALLKALARSQAAVPAQQRAAAAAPAQLRPRERSVENDWSSEGEGVSDEESRPPPALRLRTPPSAAGGIAASMTVAEQRRLLSLAAALAAELGIARSAELAHSCTPPHSSRPPARSPRSTPRVPPLASRVSPQAGKARRGQHSQQTRALRSLARDMQGARGGDGAE